MHGLRFCLRGPRIRGPSLQGAPRVNGSRRSRVPWPLGHSAEGGCLPRRSGAQPVSGPAGPRSSVLTTASTAAVMLAAPLRPSALEALVDRVQFPCCPGLGSPPTGMPLILSPRPGGVVWRSGRSSTSPITGATREGVMDSTGTVRRLRTQSTRPGRPGPLHPATRPPVPTDDELDLRRGCGTSPGTCLARDSAEWPQKRPTSGQAFLPPTASGVGVCGCPSALALA